MLAALIACAMFLSFLHGWSATDDANATLSQASVLLSDTSQKAPAHPPLAHSDHCLSHVTDGLCSPVNVVPAGFGQLSYIFHDDMLPKRLDRVSPFKPPRA
jgi:hypothetical protein